MSSTKPDVFIIESLYPEDEVKGSFEGKIISHIFKVRRKRAKYRYVRSKEQFFEAIEEFCKSNFRYLHISAHGDEEGLGTTICENISGGELAKMLQSLKGSRRLFVSSCEVMNEKFATPLIKTTSLISVTGPTEKIGFATAEVLWHAVYHLTFAKDRTAINNEHLKKCLDDAAKLFGEPLLHSTKSLAGEPRHHHLGPKAPIENKGS